MRHTSIDAQGVSGKMERHSAGTASNVPPPNYVVSQMLPASRPAPKALTYYQRRWVEKALVWIAGNRQGRLYRKKHVSSALMLCGIPPSTATIARLYKINYEKHGDREYIDSDTFIFGMERLLLDTTSLRRAMKQWLANALRSCRESSTGGAFCFNDLEQVCLRMSTSTTSLAVQRNKLRQVYSDIWQMNKRANPGKPLTAKYFLEALTSIPEDTFSY